jgi:hypothetical protein
MYLLYLQILGLPKMTNTNDEEKRLTLTPGPNATKVLWQWNFEYLIFWIQNPILQRNLISKLFDSTGPWFSGVCLPRQWQWTTKLIFYHLISTLILASNFVHSFQLLAYLYLTYASLKTERSYNHASCCNRYLPEQKSCPIFPESCI